MILTFKVKNFKSFGEEIQTFSMIAGKQSKHSDHLISLKDYRVLKFAAIYGANASGKSSFIQAINYALHCVLLGNFSHTQPLPNKTLSQDVSSYFEFEIFVNNNFFSYGFEINFHTQSLISEWLIDFTSASKPKIIFERTKDGISSPDIKISKNKALENMFNVFKKEYEHNTTELFINYLAKKPLFPSQNKQFDDISRVFTELLRNISITYPQYTVSNYETYIIQKKDELGKILQEFSTGITKIDFNEVSITEFLLKTPQQLRKTVEFNIQNFINSVSSIPDTSIRNKQTAIFPIESHLFFLNYDESFPSNCKFTEIMFLHNDVRFDFGEESEGTQRLVQLLTIMLDNSENKTFFIDEIDRSLHPLLTKKFIQLFFQMKKEINQQLIITTHESRLLDFSLIRQDEIWFAEKKQDSTELFSLEDFGERNDRKLDAAYLDGRYGGIPVLADDFFEGINESR